MFDPNKRLGEEKHGPDLTVIVGAKPGKFDPSKRLGDSEPGGEAEPQGADPEQIKADAAEGLCKALNVSTSAAPRVAQYLEAFCRACDSEPHSEGEHENESQTEDSEQE